MDAASASLWLDGLDGLADVRGGDDDGGPAGDAVEAPVTPTELYEEIVHLPIAVSVAPAPPPFVGQGRLTEDGARAALAATGWPVALHNEAVAVFCGIGNARFPNGESGCNPGVMGDNGRSYGFAQLNGATWAPYCGVTLEALLDLHTNLACAYQVYLYDLGRGYAPWTQWSVKPW